MEERVGKLLKIQFDDAFDYGESIMYSEVVIQHCDTYGRTIWGWERKSWNGVNATSTAMGRTV